MTVEHVNIAEFRRHMRRFMSRVRNGETIRLFDRDTPVASLTPVEHDADHGSGLTIFPPQEGRRPFEHIKPVKLRRKAGAKRDALTALAEDRAER